MKIINKIVTFIKDRFIKKTSLKAIETPKHETTQKFKESLSVTNIEKNKIETLICPGDGLGIQNKISF